MRCDDDVRKREEVGQHIVGDYRLVYSTCICTYVYTYRTYMHMYRTYMHMLYVDMYIHVFMCIRVDVYMFCYGSAVPTLEYICRAYMPILQYYTAEWEPASYDF